MYEFPDPNPLVTVSLSYTNVLVLKQDGSGYDPVPQSVVDSVSSNMVSATIAALAATSSVQTDNIDMARSKGYTYIDKSDALVKPPPKLTSKRVKVGTSFKDFKARQKAGEIMMSNYENGYIELTLLPGLLDGYSSYTRRDSLDLYDLTEMNVLRKEGPNYFFGSYVINLHPIHRLCSYRRKGSRGTAQWVFPSVPDAQQILNLIMAKRLIDPNALIINTAAKAGRSSLDLLTAAAEMPKTLRSVYQGAKLVAQMIKDVKRRKFSLTRAHEIRKKRVTSQYLKRVARLDKELANKKLHPYRRTALAAQRKRIEIGYRETIVKSADELASSIANVWMNYRYNIMTNVYLAQDTYDAVTKLGRRFVTSKGTQRKSGSIELFGTHFNVDETLRCTIKRRFAQDVSDMGASVISNDVFVTAWELVPLSYVIDWFVNVGDLLASRSYTFRHEQQEACLTSKLEMSARVDYDDGQSYTIMPQIDIKARAYIRTVIEPSNYCGLVWQPSMGLERQLDAAALIWRPVRSLLLKGKHR